MECALISIDIAIGENNNGVRLTDVVRSLSRVLGIVRVSDSDHSADGCRTLSIPTQPIPPFWPLTDAHALLRYRLSPSAHMHARLSSEKLSIMSGGRLTVLLICLGRYHYRAGLRQHVCTVVDEYGHRYPAVSERHRVDS